MLASRGSCWAVVSALSPYVPAATPPQTTPAAAAALAENDTQGFIQCGNPDVSRNGLESVFWRAVWWRLCIPILLVARPGRDGRVRRLPEPVVGLPEQQQQPDLACLGWPGPGSTPPPPAQLAPPSSDYLSAPGPPRCLEAST